jgi:hypothetical protein
MDIIIGIIIVLVIIVGCWIWISNLRKQQRRQEHKFNPNLCPRIKQWVGDPDCSHCSEENCSYRVMPFWYVEKGTYWKIPLPKEKDNPSRPARSNNDSKYDPRLDG